MADGETEPAADADRLGGEEHVEDARQHLGQNARAGVVHLDDRTRADPARRYSDGVAVAAPLRQGLRGVDDQVQQDLTEARFVAVYRRRVFEIDNDSGAVA